MRMNIVWGGNHYETESIMRAFLKVFINFDSFDETYNV